MSNLSPIPRESPVLGLIPDGKGGSKSSPYISETWDNWFLEQTGRINASAEGIGTVSLPGTQNASIGATPVPMPSLPAALYRVSVYARITQPGTISSSLTISIQSTDGAVLITQSGTAMTGNTTATVQSLTFLCLCDPATAIAYSTTYASAGATAMTYLLQIRVEAL